MDIVLKGFSGATLIVALGTNAGLMVFLSDASFIPACLSGFQDADTGTGVGVGGGREGGPSAPGRDGTLPPGVERFFVDCGVCECSTLLGTCAAANTTCPGSPAECKCNARVFSCGRDLGGNLRCFHENHGGGSLALNCAPIGPLGVLGVLLALVVLYRYR